MKSLKDKLSGVFAPVVTPFRNDEIFVRALGDNLKKLNKTALTGYLALGSNGEFRSLSDREQIEVLEVFAREKGNKVVMVGTSCESTIRTIENTKRVAAMGFDFASILTPSYFARRMTEDVLTDFFERIADKSPIPVLLYNAPGFAGGVQLSPKAVSRLARHRNIVGMKDSSPQGPNRFLAQIDSGVKFYVLAGSADFLYPALHLGAVGGILSLANALPAECCRLYKLFRAGKYAEACDLHFRLMRLNGAVSGTYGVAGVKGAMDICGFTGGEPRHPLLPVTAAEKETIRAKILDEGFTVG